MFDIHDNRLYSQYKHSLKKIHDSIMNSSGCLLEKMIARRSLAGITHIIIDEVHERDEDTDMLMLLIRHLIIHPPKGPSPITKLILMSATMQPESFQEYFKVHYSGFLYGSVWM